MSYSNSTGHDDLDSAVIKHGAGYLHGPITHIVNLSITTERFATKWKIGRLLPLNKGKGLRQNDPESFRPILLLPVISKITERALQPQIMDYMSCTAQLNENIHSYRSKDSTTTALLQLSNDIFESCNVNKISMAVTIDQSMAFNVLQHDILLQKHMGSFKLAGTDGIKPIVMKHFGPKALGCITKKFQAIYSTGCIPKELRKSRVVFIPKPQKSDYGEAGSFRHISLTQFIFKTME